MPYDFIINTAVTLFVVIDPLGLAPIFVGVTDGMTTAQRREVAARATIIAIIVLVATLFVGKPLLAAYSAFRSGHAMNNQLLRALLAQPDAYEIVSFDNEREAPLGFAQLAPAW